MESVEVFQGILDEIAAAESQLSKLQEKSANQRGSLPSDIFEVLKDGMDTVKKTTLEGLVDDNGMRYYLAVGELEETVKSLRNLKEVSEKINQENKDEFSKLKVEIDEQKAVNPNLEAEIAQLKSQSVKTNEARKLVEEKELKSQMKTNKAVLKNLKGGFRKFLDDIALRDGEGDSMAGVVLQTLWSQFLKDPEAWVDVDGISYDVPEGVLQHLVEAEVVLKNPADANQIKLENFTMMD